MVEDNEYYQARYTFDRWLPERRHRKLRMIKTGTWFFGLFNTYKLEYTEWEYD